jgi:uncharacterized protein (TIGR00725 family)
MSPTPVMRPGRRPVLSVIGNGTPIDRPTEQLCLELGRRAIDAGFRIACGGLGGVMAAVARGARLSERWHEGDVVGILPGYDASAANEHVDVVVPTGLGWARNVLVVAMADVVVAVGGGSGTLSELAYAWQLGKPIVGLGAVEGWSRKLGGERLDQRRGDQVWPAPTPELAIAKARELIGLLAVA